MTDSKMMQLTKPVLKPEWVLESIQQQKRLPELNYQLYKLDPGKMSSHSRKLKEKRYAFGYYPTLRLFAALIQIFLKTISLHQGFIIYRHGRMIL